MSKFIQPQQSFDFNPDEKMHEYCISAQEVKAISDIHKNALKHTLYPFNRIINAAYMGKYHIELKILIVSDIKKLKEMGYNVEIDITKEQPFKISWQKE